MAGDTRTSATEFFKQVYSQYMGDDQQNASPLWGMVEKVAKKEEVGGRNLDAQWVHQQYEGVGMSALSEGGDYPTAASDLAINPSLGLAHWAFAVDFTGHLEAQGSDREAGWAGDWKKKKAKALRNRHRSLLARFAMHDGTANWGTVATVSGTTNGFITVSGVPIHFFYPGETLTIRDLTTGGSEQLTGGAGSGLIVDVDYENERVYLADVTGAAAADTIALDGFYDQTVPNGIKNIIDSGGTIQGVNRSTVGNFMYRATEQTTTSALSPSDVDALRDAVEDLATTRGLKYKSTWIGNRKMRRWATLATIGQNRFADLDLTLGVPKVKIGDRHGTRDFITDQYIVDGELYVACFEDWIQAYPKKMKGGYPVMNGSSVLWPATAASGTGYADRRIMYWACRTNLGARCFRTQAKRTGIVSP